MVRTARLSTIGAAIFLIAAASPAQAYGSAEDVESFSSALLHARYADIAQGVISDALTRGVQDPNGLLAYALSEITATAALQTTDATQRVAKLKEAVSAYEEYLKKFPKTDKAAEARLKLSEWLRTAGENVAAQLKKETDAAKKETLKNDGLNFFTKAEVLGKARIDDILKTPKDSMTDIQKAELQALRLVVARMPYSKALLYENRTGVEAQSLLNEAQTLLEEFDLEYPGEILAFHARRIIALIMVERGDLKGAEETIGYSCEQLAEADPAALKDVPGNEENRELVAFMFLEKAEFLTKTKKPADWKGALETVEQLNKLVPGVSHLRDGKQAMMIMAEALAEDGQTAKAVATAQKVFDADPTGDAGLRARELIEKIGPTSPGGGADAASMLKLLAGAVERRDIAQGERMAAKVMTSPDVKPEDRATALLQLGGLYFQTGRFVDSAVAFQAIAEEHPTLPIAPEARFNEALSFAKQSIADGRRASQFWMRKSQAARNELLAKYPQSKEAQDVAWFAAEEARAEGRDADAVDLYLKVPATSPKYSEAQYEAGALAFDLGVAARLREKPEEVVKRFKQCESALKTSISAGAAASKTTINPNELARIKHAAFVARLRLAGLYLQKEIRNPEVGLKVLDEVEGEYKGDKERLGKVWSLKIKTLNLLGRGRDALKLLEENKETATPETFVMVAAELDKDAITRLAGSPKDPKELEDIDLTLRNAAELYSKAVEKSGGGASAKLADDFYRIGNRLLSIGARLSKIPDDFSLMGIDPTVPLAEKAMIERGKKALSMATVSDEVDVERQRAMAFAAAATGDWLEAITALREVTNKHPLFNDQGNLNKEVLEKYPRLPDIYQDMAVAHIRAAKGEKSLYDAANDILARLINNSQPKSKRYWEARYLHLVALKEGGMKTNNFAELDATLDSLERTAPEKDKNEWGIKAKIDEIRAFRSKNIINK